MNEETIRQALRAAAADLERLDSERHEILGVIKHFEQLLKLRSYQNGTTKVAAPTPPSVPLFEQQAAPPEESSLTIQEAVEKAIRNANGAPLKAQEIKRRAIELGARIVSNPKYPYSSGIDFQLYRLKGDGIIEKAGPGLWRLKI